MAPGIQIPGVFWYIGSLYLSGGITVFSKGFGGFRSLSGWNFHFLSATTELVWRAPPLEGNTNRSKLLPDWGQQSLDLTKAILRRLRSVNWADFY